MTAVTERLSQRNRRPVFVCDFSPPRGADFSTVEQVKRVGADFVSVAYSPGRSVRVDSTAMAQVIGLSGDQDVIFSLAPRDMNKLALQNHLLGAQALGLENVVVLGGDDFTTRDRGLLTRVNDYSSTGLIKAIGDLNRGEDFRGLKLRKPTRFCIGAVIDFCASDIEREARLTERKVRAGAHFFFSQAFYTVEVANRFYETYRSVAGGNLILPVFHGLQILERNGIIFGDVPAHLRSDLEKGRSALEIALEQLHSYVDNEVDLIYLIPPILKGGRRNYAAAEQLLVQVKAQVKP